MISVASSFTVGSTFGRSGRRESSRSSRQAITASKAIACAVRPAPEVLAFFLAAGGARWPLYPGGACLQQDSESGCLRATTCGSVDTGVANGKGRRGRTRPSDPVATASSQYLRHWLQSFSPAAAHGIQWRRRPDMCAKVSTGAIRPQSTRDGTATQGSRAAAHEHWQSRRSQWHTGKPLYASESSLARVPKCSSSTRPYRSMVCWAMAPAWYRSRTAV